MRTLDLLKPGADVRKLDRALCDAARAAKRERAEGHWDEKEDSNFSCPTWRGLYIGREADAEGAGPVQFTLAPGTVKGRAGGLIFVYSPYDIGAYVEGGYDVLLPLAVFRDALKPEYAGEFAGLAQAASEGVMSRIIPPDERRAFILANTRLQRPPHVPELQLHLADEVTPIWRMTEEALEEIGLPPPFWAFAWAGGQGLARWLLDNPSAVGRASGCWISPPDPASSASRRCRRGRPR